jgi:hypothetical protein
MDLPLPSGAEGRAPRGAVIEFLPLRGPAFGENTCFGNRLRGWEQALVVTYAPPTRAVKSLWAGTVGPLGIDLDERWDPEFQHADGPTFDFSWGTTRRCDGTVIRP